MTDTPLYTRASDDMLRENGFDPAWFSQDEYTCDGPYRSCRVFDEQCPCCDGKTSGWIVVDLVEAIQVAGAFFGDNGECEADEHAQHLNSAWLKGFHTPTPRN